MTPDNKPLTTGKVIAIFLVTLGIGIGALFAGLPHKPGTPLVTTNSRTGDSITCYGGVAYGSKTDCARALATHSSVAWLVVAVVFLLIAAAVGAVVLLSLSNRAARPVRGRM